jgi:hypothetical protein
MVRVFGYVQLVTNVQGLARDTQFLRCQNVDAPLSKVNQISTMARKRVGNKLPFCPWNLRCKCNLV